MATYKSTTLNLYDSVNGALYTTNVLPDRVEHNAGTSKPQYLLGSGVAIYNNDGTYTTDVVKDLYSLKAGQAAGRVYANAAVTAETTARAAMDFTLTAKIDLEISNRTAADNLLTASVAADKIANNALIAGETSVRSTSDQEIKTSLEAEAAARAAALISLSADLAAEGVRALAAEQAQTSARDAADVILRADLAAESVRALAAEQKEATDRDAADVILTAKLNKEIADRAADVQTERNRIDAILDGSTVDLNQLKELVDNYKLLDTNQTTQIDSLTALTVSLQSQVIDLKTKLDCALITGDVDNSVELASFAPQVTAIAADQAFPISQNNSWYYMNDPTNTRNKKINWYFMGGQDATQHKLISDLTSASFAMKVLSNVSIPFITVYSKLDLAPGAVNGSSWYQARKVYIVADSSVIAVNGLYTFYVGAVPTFYTGTLVQLTEDTYSSTSGAAADNFSAKEFLTMSVGSNSGASAGNVKFEMSTFHSKFGADSFSFRLV
jgi:hypothetical protein